MDHSIHVLMVEDNERHHGIYEMSILDALQNAQVNFASDGEQALERINKGGLDLIILDLNIPKISGEEVLKRVRANSELDSVPVVILTGDSDYDLQSRLLESGADDFIEKGSSPAVFVARIRAQVRHRLAMTRLTQLALDMDIFTSGVLHDIRNIETSMVALCDLLKFQVEDDPVNNRDRILEDIANLKSQANRISDYAGSVLRNVRQTSAKSREEPIDLKSVFRWTESMIEAGSKELDDIVTFEFAEDLQPVIADPDYIRLALLNMVQNAVRYARDGVASRIKITQRPPLNLEGRTMITTCIRDNGHGIHPDQLLRIFQPFARGSVKGEKNTQGFGLGLALVARAFRMMGGRVWGENPDDGLPGALFCFELPVAL